ncbi:DeoR family transcriptional regulator [Micromonospora sp. 067-2]|uniref:DeoR family transcriptional regulator n=1 Tax=Micromonospora sp. 067-2 TaxID=2789270 RepID=UPI00397DE05A
MRHASDVGRQHPGPIRRRLIVALLAEHDFLSVDQIQASTNASLATIRRDLRLLDRLGHVMRVHGGAQRRAPAAAPAEPQRRISPSGRQPRTATRDEMISYLLAALATARRGDLADAERSLGAALESCRWLRRDIGGRSASG